MKDFVKQAECMISSMASTLEKLSMRFKFNPMLKGSHRRMKSSYMSDQAIKLKSAALPKYPSGKNVGATKPGTTPSTTPYKPPTTPNKASTAPDKSTTSYKEAKPSGDGIVQDSVKNNKGLEMSDWSKTKHWVKNNKWKTGAGVALAGGGLAAGAAANKAINVVTGDD
jgi:hypothetical protein